MILVENRHIFHDHLLQPQHPFPVVKASNEQIWPSVFLIICLGLLVLVKIRSFPRAIRIIQSTFSSQVLQQLEREEHNPFKFYSIALNLFFVLNVSFLVFKINTLYNFVLSETSYFVQFCFFLAIVLFVFSFKALINRLLAFFTDERKIISEYVTSSTLVNQAFGLFLFPWIVLVQFSTFNPWIFISGALAVLAAAVVLKWYRGVIMGLVEERIGLLQIFSYFCGLEILPVFVLIKYIIETF
jgi:hypothetical protein